MSYKRPPNILGKAGAQEGPFEGARARARAKAGASAHARASARRLRALGRARAAAREAGATQAYPKERSPSCGCSATHVAGSCVPGRGVTAELLTREGLHVEGVEGRRE